MRIASILGLAVVLTLSPGCATMLGVALGGVLCSAGDDACRNRLFEDGVSSDAQTLTRGGRSDTATSVYDCETNDGRHSVIETTNDDASQLCVRDSGAFACSCELVSRH